MKSFDEIGEMIAKGMSIRANIVPVIDADDEDILLHDDSIESELPILPLMDQVLLPGVLIPIAARREKARRLLGDVGTPNRHIAVFLQRGTNDDPTEHDLAPVGVVAKVLKVFDFKEDTTVAILQGVVRCHSLFVHSYNPYMLGSVTLAPEDESGMDSHVFQRKMKLLRRDYSELMRTRLQDEELSSMLRGIGSDKIFINFACTHIEAEPETKYTLLAAASYTERLKLLLEQLGTLKGLDELRREIDSKTQEVMNRQQREYFLRHQMDVIQEELGSGAANPWAEGDVEALRARAEKKQWPKEVSDTFDKELAKLSRIQPMSPDYAVQQTFLETLLDIPWTETAREDYDLDKARRILDRDHYGIKKVKERVIEYLAVLSRRSSHHMQARAQVLCLVGPPGTGKTSICRSVAAALGRPCRRVALGGLHDEAEIRGHRRTYVGAMPGRIIQEIIKSKVSNPVFVLDEIDKVQTNTFHGDPSSALLEVLDPEQNCRFHDNFVGLDYDLSRVLFIATANSLADIQPALLDRMEVIDFSGYVIEEKIEIAARHLLPRIMRENVVDRRRLKVPPETVRLVVNDYTREAGVRQLEKQLSKLIRHRVVMAESHQKAAPQLLAPEVKEVLGLPIHNSERALRQPREGVVTGLAWTPVGGEILFIESSLSHGKGTLTMTGNLGDVMKESATLAFEYLKAHAGSLGISEETIEKSNIHIHVPEGATPKDGPSAGITMYVAMVSAFTHRRVLPHVAMTGEITLRGDVTPVGGIKEKILAAKRAGITDLILCRDNRRDIEDIEPDYLEGLSFHYVETMDEALPLALEGMKATKKGKEKTSK